MTFNDDLALDSSQSEAIKLCCDTSVRNRICGVTGQAGTGKTTIMRQVYERLRGAGYTVALCSPTGKAAKRIREATGIRASTIHLLLEYSHPGDRDEKTGKVIGISEPKRHRHYPLEYDVILVDEAAMINHELYRNLIDALPAGGCIRFFGDVNQLPPIENDERLKLVLSPFAALLGSTQFKSVTLTTLYRQGEGSGIVSNGDLIIKGRVPRRTEDFTYHITDKPLDALTAYLQQTEQSIKWSDVSNQIITPTNVGWTGTHKLNALLQRIFFRDHRADQFVQVPRAKWSKEAPINLTVGDKVLWTENNYDLGIFNGETGTVMETSEFDEIVIDFGDRSVVVPPSLEATNKYGNVYTYDPRVFIDLAYAVTTHKSQGSEYQNVIYIMNSSRPYILGRNNFYTGVTRARKSVHVITDQKGLSLSARKGK